MIRTLTVVAGLAAAGAANAAFVGGMLAENTDSSAASSATVNGASRVYELFIVFDEADDILNSIGNANFSSTDGSNLIQTGVFGSVQDTDGQLNPGAWGFVPESQWDSYVAIGGPFPGASNTTADPSFGFTATGVNGGWFDVPGEGASRQGVAGDGVDMGNGMWGVFAGQFLVGKYRGGALCRSAHVVGQLLFEKRPDFAAKRFVFGAELNIHWVRLLKCSAGSIISRLRPAVV